MALKSLLTLIKLAKRHIDELRQEIAEREEEKKTLEELTLTLSQALEHERELAAENPLVAATLGAYTKNVKQRQEKIAEEIKRLEEEIDERTESLHDAFSEQKRYEIAHEQELLRIQHKQQHIEQQALDEIGLSQYNKQEAT